MSASTITHAKHVMKNADEKDIEAIMNEEKSVNQVYNEIKVNKIKNESHNETKKNKTTKTQEKPLKTILVNIDEILAFLAEHNEKSALCLVLEKFKDKLGEDLAVKYLSANRDHLEENIIKEEKL